jgi:hypothetical protein
MQNVLDELLNEEEAGRTLKIAVKTLQSWRSRGGGPPYIKLGRCVRYRIRDLEAFISAQCRFSTSDRSNLKDSMLCKDTDRKKGGRATWMTS